MNSTNDYLHDARVFAPPRMPSAMPQPAQFYTSSPRPYAKTSLGFYNDQAPVYDNVTDDENEEMESESAASSSNASSASSPFQDDNCQDVTQPPPSQHNGNMCFQQQQPMPSIMSPPPVLPLPSFQQQFQQHLNFHNIQPQQPSPPALPAQSNNPLANIALDQHTLQQLMVYPELLRQLNEASHRLMATKTAAANGQMPPPMPPSIFPPARNNFGTMSSQQSPGYFPYGCPFPTPLTTPAQTPTPGQMPAQPSGPNMTPGPSPVCGTSVRPVITGVFPSILPLANSQRPLNNGWQFGKNNNNNGLLKIAVPEQQQQQQQQTNGKMCMVCGEERAGLHYGVISCFACMDFFRRRVVNAVQRGRERRAFADCYNRTRDCPITKETRNNCKFCRFQKCIAVGMKSELVKVSGNGNSMLTTDSRRCQSALPPVI